MLKWCQHRVLPTTCGCGAYQAECSAYPRLAAPCQMGGGYFCSRCSLDTDKPQWTLTNDIIWLLPCLPLLCLTSALQWLPQLWAPAFFLAPFSRLEHRKWLWCSHEHSQTGMGREHGESRAGGWLLAGWETRNTTILSQCFLLSAAKPPQKNTLPKQSFLSVLHKDISRR